LKIAIIINGISRKKKRFYQHILPPLQQRFVVEVFETQFSGHAIQLSHEAVVKGFDVILSAGGDGTLYQVVNGMLKDSTKQKIPALGIIPLGSGNDFAGMMHISVDPSPLMRLLEENKPKPVDVGKISCFDSQGNAIEKYFINVCSLGMGPATVHRLERLPRWMGTGFRYYASVLNTFFTHPTENFEVRTTSWTWKGSARVVTVANGKLFGNKIYIAPEAEPDDGVFSTFIATDMHLLRFLKVLLTVKTKKKVNSTRILYNTATAVELTSPEPAWIEAEGELAGMLPARVEMQKGRIWFLS
jgi:YegS/Rv2252/BmrU family lipid kinase